MNVAKDLEISKLNLFGLSISQIENRIELEKYIIDAIASNKNKVIYGHSLGNVPVMLENPDIFYYGEQADIMLSDGRPFYLLSKMMHLPVKYEISIPNFVFLCLNLANVNRYRVFLLGAEVEINSNAINNIKSNYPNISAIEGHHGYYKSEDLNIVFEKIEVFKPNILLIGTSSPEKEMLAVELRECCMGNIIIPCGGMIDVLAGKTKVSPGWVKRFGLASFFRVMQEPKRLLKRYIHIYFFLFFKLIPILVLRVGILRDKDFSIPEYFKISKPSFNEDANKENKNSI